jgi:hypothetical protein
MTTAVPNTAPPAPLLHNGVRTVVTGRRWRGFDRTTGKGCGPHPARADGPLAFVALDPARPLPSNVGLLSVEGDGCWVRLSPLARLDHPELFAPDISRSADSR